MIDEKILLERLKEESKKWLDVFEKEHRKGNYDNYADGMNDAFDEAIDIVNQLAEESNLTPCYLGSPCEYQNEDAKMPMEYWNNGWIPCERELPPMPKENPLLEYKPLELYLVSLNSTDYPWRAFWNGKYFTDGWGVVDAIAWCPLPAPYKPGE